METKAEDWINIKELYEATTNNEVKEEVKNMVTLLYEPISKNDWTEALGLLHSLENAINYFLALQILYNSNQQRNTETEKTTKEDDDYDFTYN